MTSQYISFAASALPYDWAYYLNPRIYI